MLTVSTTHVSVGQLPEEVEQGAGATDGTEDFPRRRPAERDRRGRRQGVTVTYMIFF